MAIVRRTERQPSVPVRTEFDPFRMMEELIRLDPLRQAGFTWPLERSFTPQFEVKESKDGYVFKADLPGVKESDLDISMSGNQLTVSGKREAEQQEEGETFYAYERSYGTFTRTFTLPDSADAGHVKAELQGGVLTLNVGRKAEMQPKKINISAPTTPTSGGKAKA